MVHSSIGEQLPKLVADFVPSNCRRIKWRLYDGKPSKRFLAFMSIQDRSKEALSPSLKVQSSCRSPGASSRSSIGIFQDRRSASVRRSRTRRMPGVDSTERALTRPGKRPAVELHPPPVSPARCGGAYSRPGRHGFTRFRKTLIPVRA
jgi:hypothetical protein